MVKAYMVNRQTVESMVVENQTFIRAMVKRTSPNCDVEELAQECTIALLEPGKLDGYDPSKGAVKTYLGALVRHMVLDIVRRMGYQVAEFDDSMAHAGHLPSPEAVCISRDTRDALEREMQTMGVDVYTDWLAFTSPEFDENAYAAGMGLTVKATRTRKSRTLALAHEALDTL